MNSFTCTAADLDAWAAGQLERMSGEVWAWTHAKGWEPDPGRTFGDEIALLHSEVSEAFEAWRVAGFADQTAPGELAKPEGVGSELADVLIRLLHCCRVHVVDLQWEFDRKMAYNQTREHRHGGKLL